MKWLIFFIILNMIVLWFLGIVVVCCDLSNFLDVNLFFILVCKLVVYSDSLVRVNVFMVYGRVLMMLCYYNIFIWVFERVIEIYKKSDGVENLKLIKVYNDLGNIYWIIGNYYVVKECFEKVIEIIEKSYFEVIVEVVDVY